ncbi:MAG: radical SAM protein [Bacteroidetes bacterium]|nr:radical SAM protein [Bacteroidota bacterium]MBS1975162.1 radical SAM protein [Bacteroidota bacterium]
MEAFYTLQGEGHHQGRAAYFIRLGGCDVGCAWCDVKESWDAKTHPEKKIDEIVEEAVASRERHARSSQVSGAGRQTPDIVVVTGGEPLMHDCTGITKALHNAGFKTHLETSGTHPLSGEWDWVCFSPKKFKEPLPGIFEAANELKVVVYNRSDFKWAEKNAALVPLGCKLFLQPEWSKSTVVTPMIIEYIKQNPLWEFSLQLHKYIQVP